MLKNGQTLHLFQIFVCTKQEKIPPCLVHLKPIEKVARVLTLEGVVGSCE